MARNSDDRRAVLKQVRALLDKQPAKAEANAAQMLRSSPDDPAALLLMARALRAQGKNGEAAPFEQQSIEASTRDPRHRAVAQALQQRRTGEANRLLEQILADDGDDVLALMLFGSQASRGRQVALADEMLQRAAALAPSDPNARFALADHFARTKRFKLAVEELESLPEPVRSNDLTLRVLADCLGELGRVEEQLAILRALAKRSSQPLAFNLRIGHALRALGRQDEAAEAYRAVLAEFPSEGTSWWSLASLKGKPFTERDLAMMTSGLADRNAPVENHIRLNFALGKAYEDRGDADEAFRHYDQGNRLRASIAPYDPDEISRWVDQCLSTFDAEFFRKRSAGGEPASDPIFIVGMQRSGSTLVEQILASHPAIEGTAELNDLQQLVIAVDRMASKDGRSLAQGMADLDPAARTRLGADYLQTTRIHRQTDRPRFTDKMPNNWMHVALIRLVLPNAKIVDVRRNPMDCGFSNWKQLYARGLDHSNSLATMGRYYADYARLMRHYDEVLPGAVHRVIYEELVDDVEKETRRLLDYLDLPFDPACLEFHETDRPVLTISASQVRQPINRKGIGAWEKFGARLDPLAEALGPVRDDWRR